jgi:hypothetical protein
MHENRETSRTSAVKPGSRSAGEGKSHTARVYVYEESHNGIVPMNHSNKDSKSSAESAEGRPLIKENACQPNIGRDIAQSTLKLGWGGLLDTDGVLIAQIAQDSVSVCFERLCHWSSR